MPRTRSRDGGACRPPRRTRTVAHQQVLSAIGRRPLLRAKLLVSIDPGRCATIRYRCIQRRGEPPSTLRAAIPRRLEDSHGDPDAPRARGPSALGRHARVAGAGRLHRRAARGPWRGLAAGNRRSDRAARSLRRLPAVIFDNIPGYPGGYRVLVNTNGTPGARRSRCRCPIGRHHDGLRNFWRGVLEDLRPIPPVEVETGPVMENVLEGDDIDLERFPVPLWHPKDGGRYIGTASMNILADPDSDWVNVGTYRNQIFSRDTMGIYISPGKHGKLIREKYFDRGLPCPVVVVVGADPLLFMASCAEGIAYGQSEFGWAGGVRGRPIEVVRGKHTGIAFPANAEIAIEGWIDPVERHHEGPYGEWMGYYASGEGETPVDPRLGDLPPQRPDPAGLPAGQAAARGQPLPGLPQGGAHRDPAQGCRRAQGHGRLDAAGRGQPNDGRGGHRTGVSRPCQAGAHGGLAERHGGLRRSHRGGRRRGHRHLLDGRCDVGDHDPLRSQRDVSIVDRAWSGPLDPAIHPDQRGYNSRLLIDATKPGSGRTASRSRSSPRRWPPSIASDGAGSSIRPGSARGTDHPARGNSSDSRRRGREGRSDRSQRHGRDQ